MIWRGVKQDGKVFMLDHDGSVCRVTVYGFVYKDTTENVPERKVYVRVGDENNVGLVMTELGSLFLTEDCESDEERPLFTLGEKIIIAVIISLVAAMLADLAWLAVTTVIGHESAAGTAVLGSVFLALFFITRS